MVIRQFLKNKGKSVICNQVLLLQVRQITLAHTVNLNWEIICITIHESFNCHRLLWIFMTAGEGEKLFQRWLQIYESRVSIIHAQRLNQTSDPYFLLLTFYFFLAQRD